MARDAIAVIGSINQDFIFEVQRLPNKGETLTANNFSMCSGGKGANQSVQCAKLGAKVYMAGRVGCDSFGDMQIKKLNEYGVDVSYISRSKDTYTGLGSVQALPGGGVYATIFTGANFDMDTSFVDNIEPLFQKCKIVVMQMEIPMPVIEESIQRAKQCGCYVILNAAPAKPIDLKVLKLVDCLVVNESEAAFYVAIEIHDVETAKKGAMKLLDMVGKEVIVTLGEKGSVLCNQAGTIHFAANTSVQAVDTTGAGDSYIGAIATKLLEGEDMRKACEFASRIAAFTVTRVGAQEGMPTALDIGACK